MNQQQLYRQGDVLIQAIGAPPKGPRTQRASGVLAEGEATGHAHRVADTGAAELYECGDGLYLAVGEAGVSITHDEHAPIALPPGDYRVTRQREYYPEAIRNVAD